MRTLVGVRTREAENYVRAQIIRGMLEIMDALGVLQSHHLQQKHELEDDLVDYLAEQSLIAVALVPVNHREEPRCWFLMAIEYDRPKSSVYAQPFPVEAVRREIRNNRSRYAGAVDARICLYLDDGQVIVYPNRRIMRRTGGYSTRLGDTGGFWYRDLGAGVRVVETRRGTRGALRRWLGV